MYRASEAIDLNPWSTQGQLGQHPSIQGQPIIHGASVGPSSRELSREAAARSALMQAVAEKRPARPSKAPKGLLSLWAHLRRAAPSNSAA